MKAEDFGFELLHLGINQSGPEEGTATAKLLAELSEDLGEAMVGINEQEIELLMAERGK